MVGLVVGLVCCLVWGVYAGFPSVLGLVGRLVFSNLGGIMEVWFWVLVLSLFDLGVVVSDVCVVLFDLNALGRLVYLV